MGQKYAEYDSTGKIYTYKDDEIHAVIPKNTIPITDDEWQSCIDNQGDFMVDISAKKLILVPVIVPTQAELNAAYNRNIISQIIQLEQKHMPNPSRTFREAALGDTNALNRLQTLNQEVEILRQKLK